MFWQSTLDAVTDAVCFLDLDQRILHCNRAMTEMFGLTPKEIIGKHCWEIVHGTTKPISKCPATRARKSFSRENGEIRKGDRWFNIIADPILDKKGKIKGVVHTLQDITEHKRTIQYLQESENKYRELVENVSEVIFSVDIQGCITYISPDMEHLTGYSTKEVIGTNITKHIIPEDLLDVLASINRILASGQNEAVEYRIKIKNGEIRNVVSSSNIILKNGQPAGLNGVIIDITQRKQSEEALRDAELKFRTIFDSASDGILLADAGNKRFTSANKKMYAMLGYTKDELLKLRVSDIHPQESLPYVIDQFEKLARKEIAMAHDIPVIRKDKTVFFADVNSSSIILDGKEYLIGMFRDITERKAMEEALRQEQQFLKSLLDNLPEIFYLFTYPENRLMLSNKQVETLLGFNAEEIHGRHVTEWFAPEYRDAILKAIDEVMEKGKNSIEAPLLTKDGQQIPFFLTGAKFEVNEQSYFMGIGMDLTERKKAEENLKQSQLFNEAVINSIPGLLYLYDETGHLIQWNKQHEELTGYSGEEIKDRYILDWFGGIEPDTSSIKKGMADVMAKGYGTAEARLTTKDGNSIPMYFTGVKLNISGRDHLLGIGTDITERKKAEKELEKYREHLEELVRERTIKLEASNKELEAFSYSASHDLRAPLRSIEGFSQALLEDYRDKLDIQGKDYLTRIKTATRRMADLIEDMMQLSRITRMEMNIEKVNLTLIARSVMSELQKSQPQRQVEISIADSLEDTADLRLMRIVLDNLLSNAWKFTEKQAKAKIEFGLWKTEGSVKAYFIRDNGAGFDMAYSDKLFAPFQRLHVDDEFPGTGIGLATVRRIINRHGGKVWAEGEIDKGASFYFSINEK